MDKKLIFFFGIFLSFSNVNFAHAQSIDSLLSERYVTHYDTGFNGIGPKVYHLPLPRTKEELLLEAYEEKTAFTAKIERELHYQELLSDFCNLDNQEQIRSVLPDDINDFEQWDAILAKPNIRNNSHLYIPLLVEQAKAYIINKKNEDAIEALHLALSQPPALLKIKDQHCIRLNLIDLYLYNNNVSQAEFFLSSIQAEASKNQTNTQHAQTIVKEATVLAHAKNFEQAEQLIIRKAIPLFNRSKSIEGKIWAWKKLAQIYQMDNKYTEAQWFLLQARNLAHRHQLNEKLADIEYLLAISKYHQKNFGVAKNEFIRAEKLAKEEDNKILELAIQDKLGEVYLMQKKYGEAQLYLESYWHLRNQLF